MDTIGWLLTRPETWFALVGYVLLLGLSSWAVRWLWARHIALGLAAALALLGVIIAYAVALPLVQQIFATGFAPEGDEWAVALVRGVNIARNVSPGLVFAILIWRGLDAIGEKRARS